MSHLIGIMPMCFLHIDLHGYSNIGKLQHHSLGRKVTGDTEAAITDKLRNYTLNTDV